MGKIAVAGVAGLLLVAPVLADGAPSPYQADRDRAVLGAARNLYGCQTYNEYSDPKHCRQPAVALLKQSRIARTRMKAATARPDRCAAKFRALKLRSYYFSLMAGAWYLKPVSTGTYIALYVDKRAQANRARARCR